MQLSRDSITQAALEILSEFGLADVSMRRIASCLGVAPGALYWHVSNKQELIASMAEAILAPLTDSPAADPAELSAQLWRCVLAVRDGAEIVVAAISQPQSGVGAELEAVFLRVVGQAAPARASQSNVRSAARGLLHLTLGAAAVEQSGAQLADATGAADGPDAAALTADHARAVSLLLAGLEQAPR